MNDAMLIALVKSYIKRYHPDGPTSQAIGKPGTGLQSATLNHSNNIASGDYSHAIGLTTKALGIASHAEGDENIVNGYAAHAEGKGNIANGRLQHVQGSYNVQDDNDKYADIIGGGSSDTDRKNIHTVDWGGKGWFAGGLKVGGTGQDDENAKEVATKEDIQAYVDEAILGGAW